MIVFFKGGIDIGKNIKINKKNFNIKVKNYNNGRMKLIYTNHDEMYEITLDLPDIYLEDGKVFLDPECKKNGVLKALKKTRIIREICEIFNYNYVDIMVVKVNLGVLRKYDNKGVNEYMRRSVINDRQ